MKLYTSSSIEDLLQELEHRLTKNQVKDAIHKIKFMTAKDVIKELLDA